VNSENDGVDFGRKPLAPITNIRDCGARLIDFLQSLRIINNLARHFKINNIKGLALTMKLL